MGEKKQEIFFFYSNHREYDLALGITKKVHAQIKELRNRGIEVYYTAYIKQGIAVFDNNGNIIEKVSYFTKSNKINYLLRRFQLLMIATKFLKSTSLKISCAYLRFHFWDSYTLKLLKVLKKKHIKIIVEAHSYPYKNKGDVVSLGLKVIYKLDDLYCKKVNTYIDLVMAVTEEKEDVWGCTTLKMENGLDFEQMRTRRPNIKEGQKNQITFMCVANEIWAHGLERFVQGIYEYLKNEKAEYGIKAYMIGEYLERTTRLVDSLQLNSTIQFVGKKYGKELEEIYDLSDIGVGVLAGYRLNVHMGTCLKTKEYTAVGLPFITAASQEAEINNYGFAFVIPEDDTPVDIAAVISFYKNLGDINKLAQKMHDFAYEKYSWKLQFDKMFLKLIEMEKENEGKIN